MTPAAAALLGLAFVAAVADWIVVAATARGAPSLPARTRWVTKPLPLILLVAAALVLEPADPAVRAWFVVALVLSLAGDVALLADRGFAVGVAAFLAAQVAYAVGFVVGGVAAPAVVVAAGAMLVYDILVGRRLVRALRASGQAALTAPVIAYIAAISAMVVTAAGSLVPVALAGAILFAASDTLLAEGRFIRPVRWGEVATMVLYHLRQGLLVLSLVLAAR